MAIAGSCAAGGGSAAATVAAGGGSKPSGRGSGRRLGAPFACVHSSNPLLGFGFDLALTRLSIPFWSRAALRGFSLLQEGVFYTPCPEGEGEGEMVA